VSSAEPGSEASGKWAATLPSSPYASIRAPCFTARDGHLCRASREWCVACTTRERANETYAKRARQASRKAERGRQEDAAARGHRGAV
jgi:hypothetical protein